MQKGMFEQAIGELEKARVLFGSSPARLAELAHAYAVAGKRAEARKGLNELNELSKRRYVEADLIALIHIGLGDHDQALKWLERAYEERAVKLVLLKVDPRLDPLRSVPRFQDLLRRMNFPE